MAGVLLVTAVSGVWADALATVEETLTISERDKQVLLKSKDGTRTVEEPGFYLLMSRVAGLPQLSEAEWSRLDSPAVANLTKFPNRYRYAPVRLTMRVYRIVKLTVEKGTITGGPYWPVDKPIYAIHGVNAEADAEHQYNEPLVVYSPVLPPELPEKRVVDGDQTDFASGPTYRLAGVFYKVIETMDEGSPDGKRYWREYPVVLGWQWHREKARLGETGANQVLSGIIVLGCVLAVALFVMFKRRAKAAKGPKGQGVSFGDYTPLRDLEAERDGVEVEEPVDDALVDAAKTYRDEHGLDGEKKD